MTHHDQASFEKNKNSQLQLDWEYNPTDASLSESFSENEQLFKAIFENCSDVVFRSLKLGVYKNAYAIYIEGLIDTPSLEESILKPIIDGQARSETYRIDYMKDLLHNHTIPVRQISVVSTMKEIVEGIFNGNVAILVEGDQRVLLANAFSYEKRSISEPGTEPVVRGPREGFTESLCTNKSMIRRRLRTPKLKMEIIQLGKLSNTQVCIAYVEGIVKPETLEEVRNRVARIDTDAILDSGYIEEFIEDTPHSPFPSVQNTERPDVVISSLLEGRVGILVDGTPFVLIVPMTIWSAIQAAEDYYEHFIYTSAIRLLRFILLCISFLLPSLYVATTTYHPQLIPERLLLTIAAARESVPFPTLIEVFLMEVMFEALREAGIRLPRPVGTAVSMVGGLVIGESAVHAGIVSAPTVIVVAFTGIASFSLPRYNLGLAFRILRFPLLFLSGVMGIFGVGAGVIALYIHLTNLTSFGVPYLAPVTPTLSGNLKDVFIRVPRWMMNERPRFLVGRNKTRTPKGQKPSVENDNE